MRKIFFITLIITLLAGCSNKETGEVETNPYRPIADLVIPREVLAGDEVTMLGRGFDDNCQILLKMNGESKTAVAKIISVDDRSLVFQTSGTIAVGFYTVLLRRDEKTTTLGGINVFSNVYNEADFEIYAVAGAEMQIFPVSVSRKTKGTMLPNSSTQLPKCINGALLPLPSGKIYFSGINTEVVNGSVKTTYSMGSYDMNTAENKNLGEIAGFFALGNIDGELHILKNSTDKENRDKIYTLYKHIDGQETLVRTFDFSNFGSLPIYEYDQVFEYDAAAGVLLIAGNMGKGGEMAHSTFSMNLATGVVTSNGGSATSKYWFAYVDTKLYCFVTESVDYVTTTKVFVIDNIAKWSIVGVGSGVTYVATLPSSGFERPMYSPLTGMIYGLDDADESGAMLTFDPATGSFQSKKWINPGISALLYVTPK